MEQKKPQIAIIGLKGLPAFGGAAAVLEHVVMQLKDKYDFTVYAIDTHTDKKGYYNGFYQRVFKCLKGKRLNTFIYYLKSVIHVLLYGKYDLVHVNHSSSGFIVPFLRLRFKVVGTAHGVVPKDDNKWTLIDKSLFTFFAFFFFRFSNVLVSVAKPHITLFQRFTKREIKYIPNGISISTAEETTHLKEDYILFSASRIISLKGCHILLEALQKLSYKGKIIIIGSLEHTPKYSQKLMDLSKGLNVEFKGLIKDKEYLFDYIRKAKFFVFPSFNEGMSNMLLEVASLKTPLICSNIKENVAIFYDDEVLFFNTGNVDDLAEKIDFALSNPEIMKEKTEKAYQHLFKEYNWKNIAAQYDQIYEKLIQKNNSRI